MASEYPVVDGTLSIQCYLEALDACYLSLCKKLEKKGVRNVTFGQFFKHFVFHTPYCKLVQKSVARLTFLDSYRKSLCSDQVDGAPLEMPHLNGLAKHLANGLQATYFDKALEKKIVANSVEEFAKVTKPSLKIASLVGNLYTGSIFASLISLVMSRGKELDGESIGAFSYGSGLISSMFVLRGRDCGRWGKGL